MVSVEYNACKYQDFFAPAFAIYPHLETQLLHEFKDYKKSHNRSSLFGRDVIFDFPDKFLVDEVWHIHLNIKGHTLWPPNKNQFSCTSDDYLIYTRGFFNEKMYSLLGVVTPKAHEQMPSHDTRLLSYFANIAAEFRNSH